MIENVNVGHGKTKMDKTVRRRELPCVRRSRLLYRERVVRYADGKKKVIKNQRKGLTEFEYCFPLNLGRSTLSLDIASTYLLHIKSAAQEKKRKKKVRQEVLYSNQHQQAYDIM
jgi:hypothetical protein